jgi:hypothetical protein
MSENKIRRLARQTVHELTRRATNRDLAAAALMSKLAFSGRKGHGGGPCLRRSLTREQIADLVLAGITASRGTRPGDISPALMAHDLGEPVQKGEG